LATKLTPHWLRRWDFLTAAAIVVCVVGAVQLVAGASATGVTTDEPIHMERAQGWLDTGWYVPPGNLVDGRPDPANPLSTPFVYGPAFSVIAHAANVVSGNEPIGGFSHTAAAYRVRHLTVALLAALAVVGIGLAAWRLTASSRAAIWTAAALLAIPRWTGQGFFNVKDVPTASGYTMITVALLFALTASSGRPMGRGCRFLIGAALACGIFVGVGTRLALWVPVLAAIITYAALRVGQGLLGGLSGDGKTDLAVAAGVLAGVAGIAAAYPDAVGVPLHLLTESVSNSANYPAEGTSLLAGHLVSIDAPWWYLPAWVGSTYPILLGALALLGVGGGLWALARSGSAIWQRRELGLILVLEQAALLPIATVLHGSTMYNGLRQHLYVLPPIAILSGIGAWLVLGWAGSRRAWRPIAVAALTVALVAPLAAQSILFPYNYVYVNPIAAIGGVDGRWETDYWFASAPEAISRVPRGVPLRCSDWLAPPSEPTADIDLYECRGDRYEPFDDMRGSDVVVAHKADESVVWVISRNPGANVPPQYCEDAGNVSRRMHGHDVTMAYVQRCELQRLPGG